MIDSLTAQTDQSSSNTKSKALVLAEMRSKLRAARRAAGGDLVQAKSPGHSQLPSSADGARPKETPLFIGNHHLRGL
jgi:hypothetical protein